MLVINIFLVLITYCNGCEDPPQNCDRDKISFYLYQRQIEQPHELILDDSDSIRQAPFDPEANFKIIIHGYTNSKDSRKMVQLREEYFKQSPWNLIFVNYAPLAQDGCYIETTFPSVPIIGKCSAKMIDEILNERNEITIDQFHIIGFSMGAQISAEISINLQPRVISHITGLDPAWPLFYPILTSPIERLNKQHANFVDVIHTNAGGLGVLYSHAHYDIYANDGTLQPGCGIGDPTCSHGRALDYYIESINSKVPFIASKCLSNWIWTITRSCLANATKQIKVGDGIEPPKQQDDEGIYSFKTNKQSPFAIGQPQQ